MTHSPDTNPLIAPFAYGPIGKLLIATDEREVFACGADDQATNWTFTAAAPVVGVRHAHDTILVLDQAGVLTHLDPDDGSTREVVNLESPAIALCATPSGHWAVVHTDGVTVGRGDHIDTRISGGNIRCAALGEGAATLAIADGNSVSVYDDNFSFLARQEVEEPPTGLAWSDDGWWLVTLPHRVFTYSPDLAHRNVLTNYEEGGLSGGVVSPTGRIVAFRIGEKFVAIMGVEHGQLGSIEYPERKVGELEFGPHPFLGIGLGLGDGNRISLKDEEVCRTDPPPGRTVNRWLVASGIDVAKVEQELHSERSAVGDTPQGCLGVIALALMSALTLGAIGLLQVL